MSRTDDSGPVPRRSPEEMRNVVGAKAKALRARRQRLGLALCSLVVLAAAVLVGVGRNGSRPGTEVRTASGGFNASTVTTAPAPTSTTEESVAVALPTTATTVQAPSTTSRPTATATTETTTTTATTTTTRTLVCHDSTDPACGPLAWDPPPGANAPLTVKVTFAPAASKAGDTVTFRVTGDDPDAPVGDCWTTATYGDSAGRTCIPSGVCLPMYGPWTPVATPGHDELTDSHVYAAAGTYVATPLRRARTSRTARSSPWRRAPAMPRSPTAAPVRAESRWSSAGRPLSRVRRNLAVDSRTPPAVFGNSTRRAEK